MEITGKYIAVFAEKQVSANFVTREFVIETEEQFPQKITIQLTQDKCDLIDPYRFGDLLKVHINLRGREWVNPQGETKYFNTVQGWRIERIGAAAPQQPAQQSPQPSSNAATFTEEEHDDLPF